jgi:5-carboxymethyl-2-hydroxymuconate isomerase
MPYLKIDYTDNLPDFPSSKILAEVHQLLAANEAISDEFTLKSATAALTNYRIGNSEEQRAFIYAQCHLLPGRSPQKRNNLAKQIASVLHELVPRPARTRILVSVEMIEMNRDTYVVDVLEGQPD